MSSQDEIQIKPGSNKVPGWSVNLLYLFDVPPANNENATTLATVGAETFAWAKGET